MVPVTRVTVSISKELVDALDALPGGSRAAKLDAAIQTYLRERAELVRLFCDTPSQKPETAKPVSATTMARNSDPMSQDLADDPGVQEVLDNWDDPAAQRKPDLYDPNDPAMKREEAAGRVYWSSLGYWENVL